MSELVFPIVGLSHFIPEEERMDFVASLPDRAEVVLLYDDANAYDHYAIQVWIDVMIDDAVGKKQVGYVSSDFTPIIRHNYPDATMLHATVVHPDTSVEDENRFEAQIELDDIILPTPPQRIDLSPIAHLPLPATAPEARMMWEKIMEYSQTQIEAAYVLALAKHSASYWGHSLSGDERTAYTLMSSMLTYVHGLWSEATDAIWQQRMQIDAIRHEAFSTPEACARVMEEEKEDVRQCTTSFFEQYTAVLKAGLTTQEQELDTHRQWLMALPNNLYAWIKKPADFASKLYYERFSIDELHAIYLHLLCIEWLKEQKSNHLPEQVEQAIAKFSFWNYNTSLSKKRNVIKLFRTAVNLPHEPIATLALRIKQAQKDKVITQHIRPFSKFVKEINMFLDTPIKENSLRHRFFPPHRDSYDKD